MLTYKIGIIYINVTYTIIAKIINIDYKADMTNT